MIRFVYLAAAALLFSGCAAPQPYKYWGKEGVSAQAAKDQLGYCRHDVGANHLEKTQANKLVAYCMRAKGYTVMTGYR
ncbi:hypothetical protein [Neisseria weixii]|uniref:hypothetical protein n=1 Tax=Neisseria weixii TaxID=1853276 RepID=UPI00359F30A1